MSRQTTIAVDAVDRCFGHETAHLTPREQIEVASRLIRNLTETIDEIVFEELPADTQGNKQ